MIVITSNLTQFHFEKEKVLNVMYHCNVSYGIENKDSTCLVQFFLMLFFRKFKKMAQNLSVAKLEI